jgi:hypothetical protein
MEPIVPVFHIVLLLPVKSILPVPKFNDLGLVIEEEKLSQVIVNEPKESVLAPN